MDKVEELIRQFQNVKPSPNSDASAKRAIIVALEDYSDDKRVLDLFLAVIADKQEYDLARVEVLKILRLKEYTNRDLLNHIADAIRDVVINDQDNLVRNYACMAASPYMGNEALFQEIAALVRNVDEDIDVRWNAFGALEHMKDFARAEPVFRALLDDVDFRDSAKDILSGQR